MNLEITNGFPTDISNMNFMLYNSISLNLIATFNIPLIESGDTYTESVSVAGETLDQIMLGIINNMDIEASGGLVPINYTDAISTKVSITEIQIMEATAYFPNQLLHEEIVEQSFNLGTTKLTEIGIKEGATLVGGGTNSPEGYNKGYYIEPTIFANVTNDMTIAREEIFGPVLSILGYKDEQDAINIANETIYGLSGYVSSENIENAKSVASKLRTGMVHINNAPGDQSAPFGGYKMSGNGREWGEFGLEDFLEIKSVMGAIPKAS